MDEGRYKHSGLQLAKVVAGVFASGIQWNRRHDFRKAVRDSTRLLRKSALQLHQEIPAISALSLRRTFGAIDQEISHRFHNPWEIRFRKRANVEIGR